MIDIVRKMLAPLATRVANMIARGVVDLVDDSTKMQIIQLALLAGETREGVERMQNYGFTSVPHPGAEAVVAFVGGRRDHGIVIAVDDRRYRLKALEAGEVALYTDEAGNEIILRRGGEIEVNATAEVAVTAPLVTVVASTKVELTTPLVEISTNATIGGTLLVTGAVTALSTVAVTAGVTAATIGATAGITGSSVVATGLVQGATVVGTTEVTGGGKALSTHTHSDGTYTSPSGDVTGTSGAPT